MKRIAIPPTKYDPARTVQAKLAAPRGGPGAAIPPTRYGAVAPLQPRMANPAGTHGPAIPPIRLNPVRGSGMPIQRAAAAGAGNGQIAAGYQTAQDGDTVAMTYLRARTQAVLLLHLGARDAVIGRDKADGSDIEPWLDVHKLQSLAGHLVAKGWSYTKKRNTDWLKARIQERRRFFVVGDYALDAVRMTADMVNKPRAKAEVGDSAEEIDYLFAAGYTWSDGYQMLLPPQGAPAAVVVAAPNPHAHAAAKPVGLKPATKK